MADPSLDATLGASLADKYTNAERLSFIRTLDPPDQKEYLSAALHLEFGQSIQDSDATMGEFDAKANSLLAKGYRKYQSRTAASTQGPIADPSLPEGQQREPVESPTSTAARSLNGSTARPPSNTSASRAPLNPSAQR